MDADPSARAHALRALVLAAYPDAVTETTVTLDVPMLDVEAVMALTGPPRYLAIEDAAARCRVARVLVNGGEVGRGSTIDEALYDAERRLPAMLAQTKL